MNGVNTIGGIPEPVAPRRQGTQAPRVEREDAASRDEVSISPEAQQAATAGKLVEISKQAEEIRTEKVAQARRNLEEGTYRVQATVLQLAARISQFVG